MPVTEHAILLITNFALSTFCLYSGSTLHEFHRCSFVHPEGDRLKSLLWNWRRKHCRVYRAGW